MEERDGEKGLSYSSVRFLKCSSSPSPLGLPSFKLVGVPVLVADKWRDRLLALDCYGLIICRENPPGYTTISFWCSPAAFSRLIAAFPPCDQLSLF